jgi:hypothetical protein
MWGGNELEPLSDITARRTRQSVKPMGKLRPNPLNETMPGIDISVLI